MTDLSVMFDQLIEHPAAAPASIDDLLERGQRRRSRRLLSGAAVAMTFAVSMVAVVSLTSGPKTATVRVTGLGVQEASYLSTADGGYRASGDWSIRIERGNEILVIDNGSDPRCGPAGVIKKGDRVLARIRNDRSYLEIGPRTHC